MIGSQAIHAITDDVLDEVLISHDCDVQFDLDDPPVAVSRKQLAARPQIALDSAAR